MTNRVALVTGGNRGIGFEVCRQLSDLNIEVILTSRDRDAGIEAVNKLKTPHTLVHYMKLDVQNAESIQSVHSSILKEYNRLDILVNNAGVYIDKIHSLLEMDANLFQTTLEINAYGPLFLTQALVPLMRQNNYGRIVNVSSSIGQLSNLSTRWPAYRLSKILLNLQTRMFAMELQGTNILINAMCPGWVRTDMGGPTAPRTVQQGADTIVWLATLPEDGPQGGYFRDRRPIEW